MNRFHLLFVGFLFALVGCTDTFDTMSREYRNQNNEAIDALMMVTDEWSARRMTQRVFKPMAGRYKQIDEKIKIIETNRKKNELVKEAFESDGFQVYLTELDTNKVRLSMEINRLRNLMNQYGKEERARLDEEGKNNEEVNFKQVCPAVTDLVTGSDLEVLKQNLTNPKLLELVAKFKDWKEPSYPILYQKFMERRKAAFAPVPVEIIF